MTPSVPLSPQAARFQALPLIERPRRRPILAPVGRPLRVHLWHLGCQMNDADREHLAEALAEIGCQVEVPLEEADLAVVVTCAVRQHAEEKVFGKLGELAAWKRRRPPRAIAVTGCMAVEHGEALLDRLDAVDYVFDVREPDGFLLKLAELCGGHGDRPQPLPASDRLSAYVPIIGGCDEMCTYCIVPFVRGRERSRPADDVVAEVQRRVERGVREVTLLGQNVNSYRCPSTGARLPHLMAAVDRVDGLWRQRFLTSHPRNASPELFAAMRDLPTACEHLHLPVQSGADTVLRRMRRVYTVAEYRAMVDAARKAVPDVSVSTDVIVGFCGETEEEFLATEQLLREVRFDVVHLQAYSPRPGTAAARRPDDVPLAEKKRRLHHLLDLQRAIAEERNRSLVGRPVEVLVEALDEQGRPLGRTRQNRVARLPRESAEVGQLVTARVRGATAWQLDCEAPTLRRTR